MHDFKKLNIWIESKMLSIEIYKVTATFPNEEKFGLTNQLRRAAISVPANIAEGAGRYSSRDFSHFINISLGSINEVYTFVEISTELNYIDAATSEELVRKVVNLRNMVQGFNRSLRTKY